MSNKISRMWENFFSKLSYQASNFITSPVVFFVVILLTATWVVRGFFVGFTERWELVLDSSTRLFTFLMLFIIQRNQNRNNKTLHLKLDELIKALGPARDHVINVETLNDEEIEHLEQEFRKMKGKRQKSQ
jgi:low affinity Fe/Cu permease